MITNGADGTVKPKVWVVHVSRVRAGLGSRVRFIGGDCVLGGTYLAGESFLPPPRI